MPMTAMAIKSHFMRVDADGDGCIFKPEFNDLTYNLGYKLNEAALDLAWDALDSSDDQKVSLEEFSEWFKNSPLVSGSTEAWSILEAAEDYPDWLRWLIDNFKWYDTTKDGKIEKDEFEKLCADFPFASPGEWLNVDQDGDGKVDFNEFMKWAWDNYDNFTAAAAQS
eukprot:TRINITY_DN2003_c0_g1_i2.p1 TRINITY_DN2003_c0_g1~~TRINITY_DN2003_c0_g1_i2.p1  ORF type:complete len:191 (+),score=43.55 TRINITY_DN2003_c0_g1_i2:75-575(+)